MRKLFFALAFMLVGTFVFANNINENAKILNIEKTETIKFIADICTITVNIYIDGELAASATWTDNDGDCELAQAGARMMAEMMLME